ncbi:hypothetical protein UQ64_14380 [Paenibacillus etheri]|uniref:Uncharacterized protein n=1 Tax=Paenibacillus etheri TaxID=1306852 RepID=A0A0W1AZF2_9BACL|nr:hypothetical protein UQ64_14380 [Paenibacillus etheri]
MKVYRGQELKVETLDYTSLRAQVLESGNSGRSEQGLFADWTLYFYFKHKHKSGYAFFRGNSSYIEQQ